MPTTQFTARLEQEDIEAFRNFIQENNITTAQGFSTLLALLELDKEKSKIQSREKEIEQFQSYLNSILRAYISSLEMNQNAESRVRYEFADKIDLQFKIIDDLNKKVDKAQEELKQTTTICDDKLLEANDIVEYNRKELLKAKEVISSLEEENAKLKDENKKNEDVIELLKDKIIKLESEQKDIRAYQEKLEQVADKNEGLRVEIQTLEFDLSSKCVELNELRTSYENELKESEYEHEKELTVLRNEINKAINERDIELANARASMEKRVSDVKEKYYIEKEKLKDEIAELKEKLGQK